jgi:aconitate hydratase
MDTTQASRRCAQRWPGSVATRSRSTRSSPVDLVIDHSVQVDVYGTAEASARTSKLEFERNRERYTVPALGPAGVPQHEGRPARHRHRPPGQPRVPGRRLWTESRRRSLLVAFPDSLVGTDSHTTMINGLGVLGWGVGGIEAEAVMLGQPMFMLIPAGDRLQAQGRSREGATATDLVLTITQLLRKKGVVDKFVEFYGPGIAALSLPTAPPSPTWRPSTARPWASSRSISRHDRLPALQPAATTHHRCERYAKENLWHDPTSRSRFTDTLELDLSTVVPSWPARRGPRIACRSTSRAASKAAARSRRQGRSKSPAEFTWRRREPRRSPPSARQRTERQFELGHGAS